MDRKEEDIVQPLRPHRYPDFFYNWITYVGVVLALLVFIAECFLFGFDFFSSHSNVYLGIVTYVVLPVFLILGLLLIPIGAVWKRRRVYKGIATAKPKLLVIDPTNEKHRNALLVFIAGTTILLVMTAVGSYKAFNYTESVAFCGTLCHKIMDPQYTAYLRSPHARVKCVDCHIGPGASWYVKSKLSGVRQIFATISNSYPRPIPTPIKDLRPAKETCEQCHWPGKFYSSVEIKKTYYSRDPSDKDKVWNLTMLMRVGNDKHQNQGIHAHMYLDQDIYYVAKDAKRQTIPWVETVDKSGKKTVYQSSDSPYKKTPPPAKLIRKMDCMDCHNQPSHQFKAPYALVNQAMTAGTIAPDLPQIKVKAMAVLSGKYTSHAEAARKIRATLTKEYRKILGANFTADQKKLSRTIDTVIALYKENFFPSMKVRWDVYPNNIGHLISPGCFRCHDGDHTSKRGRTITENCSVCHLIISQGPPGAVEQNVNGLPFKHPFSDDGSWKVMNCFDCHTGN